MKYGCADVRDTLGIDCLTWVSRSGFIIGTLLENTAASTENIGPNLVGR